MRTGLLTVGVIALLAGGSIFMEGLAYYKEGQGQVGQTGPGPNYVEAGSVVMAIGAVAIVLGAALVAWGMIAGRRASPRTGRPETQGARSSSFVAVSVEPCGARTGCESLQELDARRLLLGRATEGL